MEYKKIEAWLNNAILNLDGEGDCQDIHIDEFIHIGKTRRELFKSAFEVAEYIKENLIKQMDTNQRLYILIPLKSESPILKGVPRNINLLLNQIDCNYPPELVLYNEFISTEYYNVELYKSCLPFVINEKESVEIVYKELRSKEELINENNYRKEINIVIK